jgi:hypothetical protein
MKKTITIIFLMFACFQFAQAQNNTAKYKSVNFYKNGVTEYIDIVSTGDCSHQVDIYYFTSKNPQKIKLDIKQYTLDCYAFSECTSTFRVNFPNEEFIYKLTQGVMFLSSEDGSGKTQHFEFMMN